MQLKLKKTIKINLYICKDNATHLPKIVYLELTS